MLVTGDPRLIRQRLRSSSPTPTNTRSHRLNSAQRRIINKILGLSLRYILLFLGSYFQQGYIGGLSSTRPPRTLSNLGQWQSTLLLFPLIAISHSSSIVKMTNKAAVPFLVTMMLVTGVCNTILNKYQVRVLGLGSPPH